MNNYEKNMEALKQIVPGFAEWIEAQTQPDWVGFIKADNGDFNATVKCGIITEPIYDNKAPRKAAREITKKQSYHEKDVTVMIGAGVGHSLKAICDKMEKGHYVIVAEPTAQFIKMAFTVYDFSQWIKKKQLHFAITKADFSVIITAIMQETVIQRWRIYLEPYVVKRELEYGELIAYISDSINQIQCNMGTVMGAGQQIATNDIENLPFIIQHRGVKDLFGLFDGKPAVTVGTGPSLKKNLHVLKQIQGEVVIIAVAQALRILLAYDIRPDFICTVDYGKTNMGHFEGLMDSDVPLVALNRTYAPILKQWTGPKFIVGTPVPGYESTGVGIIAQKGSLEQGGSVAHACLGLAVAMGCSTVMMMGHDLSLGSHSHFKQADESGNITIDSEGIIRWEVTDKKSHLYGKTYSMGPATWTAGYAGGMVLTNQGLKSFITNFERIIAGFPNVKFINTTEGGARIHGAEPMTLTDASMKYCDGEIDKSVVHPLLTKEPKFKKTIKKAVPLLEADKKILESLQENAQSGIEALDKMKECVDDETQLRLWMDKQHEYAKSAEALAKLNPLVQVYIYNESVKIQERERCVTAAVDHLVKNRGDLDIRMERSGLILESAVRATKTLIPAYSNAIDLLKQYLKTGDGSLLTEPWEYSHSLDSIRSDIESGNFSRAILDCRRIINDLPGISFPEQELNDFDLLLGQALALRNKSIREAIEISAQDDTARKIKYSQLLEQGQKIGRDKKDFDQAKQLLQEAVDLFPDRSEARWGLATTLAFVNEAEEALGHYDKLVETFPKNLQYQFERAMVLLRTDVKQGLKAMSRVFEITDVYDAFLLSMGELYASIQDYESAITAVDGYTKKFPADMKGWEKLEELFLQYNKPKEAELARRKKERLTNIQI